MAPLPRLHGTEVLCRRCLASSFARTASTMQQPDRYLVRDAKPEEQRELTRLCVHATLHTGYDDAFVDRVMPGLTVMLPLITAGAVQVAEHPSGAAVGVVTVTTSGLPGVALLHGLYVDPAFAVIVLIEPQLLTSQKALASGTQSCTCDRRLQAHSRSNVPQRSLRCRSAFR